MPTKIKQLVALSDLDKDLAEEYKDLCARKTNIEQKFLSLLAKSQNLDLWAQLVVNGRSSVFSGGFGGNKAATTFSPASVSIEHDANVPFTPTPAQTYVEPKVFNNLMNGKMLTEEQKRLLLKSQLPFLFPEPEEPEDVG